MSPVWRKKTFFAFSAQPGRGKMAGSKIVILSRICAVRTDNVRARGKRLDERP
jgi:hypothetical protein